MNIVVCTKRVPDTATRIRIADDGKSISQDGVKYVTSPYDEFALEAALQLVEAAGTGEVTLLCHGENAAQEQLRSGLAMGAHKAVLLKGSPSMDGWATAQVLAAELQKVDWELILFGIKAVDDDQQQVGPMVAEILRRPCATSVAAMEVGDGTVTCRRTVEGGQEVVEMDLPAVATITKGQYEPRYASLRGIMAAKRKPLLEKDAPQTAAGFEVSAMRSPPARAEGRIVGEGPKAVPELVRLLREEAGVV